MKPLRSLLFAFVAFATLTLPGAALAQTNLLSNPGFELGPSGILYTASVLPDWNFGGTNGTTVVSSPGNAADGNQYISFSGGASGGWLSQNFTAVIGQTYTASLYVRYVGTIPTNYVGMYFQIWDFNSGPVFVDYIGTPLGSPLPSSWTLESVTFTALSAALRFDIDINTTTGNGSGTNIQADFASVTAIPEPATCAAIFGVFALGAVGIREHRRRKQFAA